MIKRYYLRIKKTYANFDYNSFIIIELIINNYCRKYWKLINYIFLLKNYIFLDFKTRKFCK